MGRRHFLRENIANTGSGFAAGDDDNAVFDRFYVENVRLFMAFGLGIVGEKETVRDTVQEAFIDLWDRRAKFGSVEQARAWLYRTIHNRLCNNRRHRDVMMRHAGMIGDRQAELNEMIEETEGYERLCRRIEQLPEMQQKVIWLHAEGLSNDRIAARLGIAVNTVLTHKQRARKALQAATSQDDGP